MDAEGIEFRAVGLLQLWFTGRPFACLGRALLDQDMAGLLVPDRFNDVVIACDGDVAGVRAADQLRGRLVVENTKRKVTVCRPAGGYNDFNDVLMAGAAA